MERLTQTSNSGGVAFTFDLDITCRASEAKKILKLAEKLKDYEDAEENGLLIKFPCKVGSKVYRFAGINGSGRIIDSTFCISDLNEIGKTVFLTKKEAEAKLAEMRGEQHE